jgi:hypothetical protein
MKGENATNPALLTLTNNFVTATDPGFVDAAKGNYTLRPGAEVFSRIPGFRPIPFNQMGLQIDKYRKRLPSDEEAGRLPSQDPWKTDKGEKNFST